MCVYTYEQAHVCVCVLEEQGGGKRKENHQQRPHEGSLTPQTQGLDLINGSYSQSTLRLVAFNVEVLLWILTCEVSFLVCFKSHIRKSCSC